MTLSKYSLNYSHCAIAELQHFVNARGLTEAGKRSELACALRKADLDSTFRFLDLPPELRNIIYKQMLEVEDGPYEFKYGEMRRRIKAPMAILATCKQIYEEAHEFAYEKTFFPLHISRGYAPRSLQLDFNLRDFATLGFDTSGISEPGEIQWPSFLAKVSCLAVEIGLDSPASARNYPFHRAAIALNRALYRLYQFVAKHPNIQHLQVKIRLELKLSEPQLRGILSPLAALAGGMQSIDFTFRASTVQKSVQLSMLEAVASFRTLRSMRDEVSRVTAKRTRLRLYGSWCDSITEKYESLMRPRLQGGIYVCASDRKLKRAIAEFEDLFEDTKKYNTDDTEGNDVENTASIEGGMDE